MGSMRKAGVASVMVGVFVMAFAVTAAANGQDTCPDDGGWVKVEPLDGLTYTFEVPDGYMVTDNCFKAATTLVFGSGATVTNTTVTNRNGVLQDISHASFLLVEIPDETTTTTTIGETTTTITEETTTTEQATTTTQGSTTTSQDTTTTTESPSTTVLDPGTPSDPTVPELPYTGAPVGLLASVAGLLTLAGVGLVLRAGRE